MKLSAILVSVNLAATLPIVASAQAKAEEGNGKDTADFLKASLAAAPEAAKASVTSKSASKAKTKRLKVVDPAATPPDKSSLISYEGVKLRPFVANRKLPRKGEIELVAQTPMMVVPQSNVLSGGVSQYSSVVTNTFQPTPASVAHHVVPVAKKSSARTVSAVTNLSAYIKQRAAASRVAPNQMPVVPGQVGFPCAERPAIQAPEPQVQQQPMQAMPQPQQVQPQLMQQMQCAQPNWQDFNPQPIASQESQATIDQAVELLRQGKITEADLASLNGCANAPQMMDGGNGNLSFAPPSSGGRSDVGPPPFPLNLFPEAALKDFVSGGSRSIAARTNAPKQYFGSWHNDGLRQLPASGFKSYLHPGRSSTNCNFTQYSQVHIAAAHQQAAQRSTRLAKKGTKKNNIAPKKPQIISPVYVATYGVYHSQPKIGY